MSDEGRDTQKRQVSRRWQSAAWLTALGVAAVVGGIVGRGFIPIPAQPHDSSTHAIVQIERQASLPSIAGSIDRICPSIAQLAIEKAQRTGSQASGATTAFVVSDDGWLVTAEPVSGRQNLQVTFSDGRKLPVDDVRTDPVSGISIIHVDGPGSGPLTFSDQSFAHIGDFGFWLQTNGTGCAARYSMIGSDFLVDSLGQGIVVSLQPEPQYPAAGMPFFTSEGVISAVPLASANNELLPAPIAAVIVAELIRNNPSPIASFGFRAIDFTPELASRIGEQRARGPGVALVQPGSAAAAGGLRAGDVIVAVNGSPVASASELSRALDAVTSTATLQIARGDQQVTLAVERTVRPRP